MLERMSPIDQNLLDEAVELTRAAGEITLRWFRSLSLAVEHKHDGTPVTEADKAAERFLREEIVRRHPHDSIVGEEEDDVVGISGRTWIIDPIDGTKAFTHGVPLYSNLLAIDDDDGPAVGVINLPGLGETIYAGRGLGCFDNGVRTTVSHRDRSRGSYLSTSAFNHWPAPMLANVLEAGLQLRTWGDGYGYALVATGRIEAMVDPEVAHWDVAPMPVIFSEAGGRFSDLHGRPHAGHGSGLATNGVLHDELLALLGPIDPVN